MTAAREAIALPLTFLTVALLGGLRISDRVALLPPPLFALVLSVLLLALLVRCGALAPDRLMHPSRSMLANLNGLVVILAVFLATAQAFNAATPGSGVPRVLFNVAFLLLLANTMAASPDRVRALRSLLVIFGSAFVVKFVVLSALSNPPRGVVARAIQMLFEGVTLGTVTQDVLHPVSGYVAFFTLMLYLFGLVLLPASAHASREVMAVTRAHDLNAN
jgi:voltage-gated potassium channel Kch